MNLDNIQDAHAFAHIESSLRQIQTLRAIAHELIDFLAQLENFQKKLWLKKKFVAKSHWLITLNHIPDTLLDTVFANEKQISAWQNLFAVKDLPPPPRDLISFKESNPYLTVDTSLFPASFQTTLIAELSKDFHLDDATDGVLIHADNFQALNLLQARYRGQVKCIYIDPPYNTGNDGFLYKDAYQHSSWLTLMENRIVLARNLLMQQSALFCQISDLENTNLNKLMVSVFGEENHRETISVITSSKSGVNAINVKRGERLFKIKEYIHFYSNNPSFRFNSFYTPDNYNQNYKWEIYQQNDSSWFVCDLKATKKLNEKELSEYALNNSTHIYSIEKNNSKAGEAMKAVLEKSKDSGNVETFTDQFGVTKLIYQGGVCVPLAERVIQENGKNVFGVLGSDIWDDIGQAAKSEGGVSFDNGKKPEKLLKRIIEMTTHEKDLVLDYFSGSGTTACVAQKLGRKWIGIEQGEYFHDVLVKRVQKTLFGEQTGISKSINYNGGGIVKVLKLESYEDTLNNLVLKNNGDLFNRLSENVKEDYLLRYLLDDQSKGSLLNTDVFRRPFDYQMDIATSSAGASETVKIDLVETFNYLLGLRVIGIKDRTAKDGYLTVDGVLPNGDKALILWRDCEKVDYEGLDSVLNRLRINPKDNEYDLIYINGDHNIATVWEGVEGMRTLKIRQTEEAFLNLMFEGGNL